MYFTSKDDDAIKKMLTIASYAYAVTLRINRDIPKYRKLIDFKLQMGADIGDFFVYEFIYQDNKRENLESEVTTIGYPANYAAKLQGLADTSSICISEDLYILCDKDTRDRFQKKTDIIGFMMTKVKRFAASLCNISAEEKILDIFIWKNGIYLYLLFVTALFLFQKKRACLLWAVLPSAFILLTYVLVIAWKVYFYIWFFSLSVELLIIVSVAECRCSAED